MVLKEEVARRLSALGRPPAEDCIVVSIDQQKLWIFNGAECWTYPVSTARAGRGCLQDSWQTPDGLHAVVEKIGADAPLGMVFKGRKATGVMWSAWPTPEDNLITTRILWLGGLERGHNLGTDAQGRVVDTQQRFVYIHGTNQHAQVGTPNSHGCVLLTDSDVVTLFNRVAVGMVVLIRD